LRTLLRFQELRVDGPRIDRALTIYFWHSICTVNVLARSAMSAAETHRCRRSCRWRWAGRSCHRDRCATRGKRAVLIERDLFARERPGETLHPGVEPLLTQLGIAERLPGVVGARHDGIWI
jgi:hypothetical protein